MKNSNTGGMRMEKKWKAAFLMIVISFSGLTGCAMDWYWTPERSATVQEAFRSYAPPGDPAVARQAVVQQVFNAPYEDVFRAVNVSASQALFHVHEQDKRAGVVLATEVLRTQPTDQVHTTFYYAILIKERGPRRTSVTIMAKVQYPCLYQVVGAGWHIATFGIVKAATALSGEDDDKESCTRRSTLRWAAVVNSDSGIRRLPFSPDRTPEIARFLSFVRNNLIAAGAI